MGGSIDPNKKRVGLYLNKLRERVWILDMGQGVYAKCNYSFSQATNSGFQRLGTTVGRNDVKGLEKIADMQLILHE